MPISDLPVSAFRHARFGSICGRIYRMNKPLATVKKSRSINTGNSIICARRPSYYVQLIGSSGTTNEWSRPGRSGFMFNPAIKSHRT